MKGKTEPHKRVSPGNVTVKYRIVSMPNVLNPITPELEMRTATEAVRGRVPLNNK